MIGSLRFLFVALLLRVESLTVDSGTVRAHQVQVEINGLSRYWLRDSVEPVDNRAGLVLGFAAVPEADIRAALARLSKVWR